MSQRPSNEEFQSFREILSHEEVKAVKCWLNVWFRDIRKYQLSNSEEQETHSAEVKKLEENFSNALQKAVVCRERVYRGLATGPHNQKALEFLRFLRDGDSVIQFESHDSASLSKEIAVGHATKSELADKELCVLLVIYPLTARYLYPFVHEWYEKGERVQKDEEEVVLIKNARYERVSKRQISPLIDDVESWEIELKEIAD